MKYPNAFIIFISIFSFSELSYSEVDSKMRLLHNAPLEWLITQTLIEETKISEEQNIHFSLNPLVDEIFSNLKYNENSDEIILQSSLKTNSLRTKLVEYVTKSYKEKLTQTQVDNIYESELESPHKAIADVRMYNYRSTQKGHYFFNHVHTNISQDNQGWYYRKMSPKTTINVIDGFVKARKAMATVALTDHDTDRGYDIAKPLENSRLNLLRGIEWGGDLHMNLIGLKADWDLLSKGREFRGEESVIMSRTSDAFRIINHPNQRDPVFPYTSWLDVNGIEVWNTIVENKPFTLLSKIKASNNRDALGQWVESLKSGTKYTAVSGSDYHFWIPCMRDRSLFYPANYIPNSNLKNTKNDLMSGNVSFLTGPKSPKLDLKMKFEDDDIWYGMGSNIEGSGRVEVELDASFIDASVKLRSACYNIVSRFYRLFDRGRKTWEVRFYNLTGDVIAKRQFNPNKYGSKTSFKMRFNFDISQDNLKQDIIRAEIWEVNKKNRSVDLKSATNPIYINY